MQKQNFNPRWEKYRDDYIEYSQNRYHYKHEASRYQSYRKFIIVIDQLYEYLNRREVKRLDQVNREHLEDIQKYLYIRDGLLPITIKQKLSALKMYFSYLVHKNILQKNPFNKVRLLPEFNPGRVQVKRYYSIEEFVDRYRNHLKRMRICKIKKHMKLKEVLLFVEFLNSCQHKSSLYKVTERDIDEYGEYLKHYQYELGKSYSPCNQISAIRTLRQFFRTLYIKGYLPMQLMKDFNGEEYKRELERIYKTKIDPPDPDSLIPLELRLYRDKFIDNLSLRSHSKSSIRSYKRNIRIFLRFLVVKHVNSIKQIDRSIILDYQDYLKNELKDRNGKNFSSVTIGYKLSQLKGFLKFLVRMEYVKTDYTIFIDIPKKSGGIPRTVMSEREVNIILSKPDILNTIGLRNKTVMEILYSTGLRATELVNVKIQDIDISGGLIRVNKPKGGKEYQRIVPIGRAACYYVKRYLKGARPELLKKAERETEYLILTRNGNMTNNHIINDIVRKYEEESGIRKHITPHSFRVTCATLMLKNNADIRYVQEQLGHRSIHSTQVYTRLVPKDLKKVHQRTHPREKR